jgi:hypothetical protein
VGGSLGAIRGHVKDHGAMAGVVPRITFACRNPPLPLRTFLRHRCHSRTVLLARITVGIHLGAALRYSSYAVPKCLPQGRFFKRNDEEVKRRFYKEGVAQERQRPERLVVRT